ncbi:MAG: hypothetical protein ABSD97_06165 [Acidimicrobiales bacterium]
MSEPSRAPSGVPAPPLSAPGEVTKAIAAAVAKCWPTERAADLGPVARGSERADGLAGPVWRFSGRWWQPPAYLRQDRPWCERQPR